MSSAASTADRDIPKKVNDLHIVLGLANFGDPSSYFVRFSTIESAKDYLTAYAKRGYRQLDTSRNYPPNAVESSEKLMGEVIEEMGADGQVLAGVPFVVDTKLRFQPPNSHSAEKVENGVNGSLEALKMENMHVEYLHVIDETSDKKETTWAMEKAFKEGKIEVFGLSNASAKQIEEFWRACEEQSLTIRPGVVQNHYNILARECEENGVMEKVRDYGLSFYAYSPAGGGLFNPKSYREREGGRFDETTRIGEIYRGKFYHDQLLHAAEKVREISEAYGLTGHTVSLRWAVWHSKLSGKHGDGVLLQASSIDQLNANLDAIESGPLPEELLRAVEEVWKAAKEKPKES